MKYFSLFTGVGGFELGIQKATDGKWECVGFSEIDKYCNMVLKYRFPNIMNYGDATKIDTSELPKFDFLCAGFPCQAFSLAGKRRGFEDTRGTLFFEITRVLKDKRPTYFLLENVKGLLNHDKGKTFSIILDTLSGLGYEIEWMVLNSKFFGVPQNRERVFIVGHLGERSEPKILSFRKSKRKFSKISDEKIHQTLDANYWKGGVRRIRKMVNILDVYNKKLRNEIPTLSMPNHNNIRLIENDEKDFDWLGRDITFKIIKHSGQKRPLPEARRVYIFNKTTPTIKDDIKFIDNVTIMNTITEAVGTRQGSSKEFLTSVERIREALGKVRRLTPIECERLQGFPDDWTRWGVDEGGNVVEISDTQRYKMMGNAVTTNVIEAIVRNCFTC